MAGTRFALQSTPEAVIGAAGSIAQAAGYTVTQRDVATLSFRKGNLALSIFIGAFVAYCDFTARVEVLPDGMTQLIFTRNTPWWTGVIGVSRVKTKARELSDALTRDLPAMGVTIVGRADF